MVSNEDVDLKSILNKVKLKIDGDDFTFFENQIKTIINWSSRILDLDTEGVEPIFSITQDYATQCSHEYLNDDNLLIKNELLLNAVMHDEDFFLVPKIINKE